MDCWLVMMFAAGGVVDLLGEPHRIQMRCPPGPSIVAEKELEMMEVQMVQLMCCLLHRWCCHLI